MEKNRKLGLGVLGLLLAGTFAAHAAYARHAAHDQPWAGAGKPALPHVPLPATRSAQAMELTAQQPVSEGSVRVKAEVDRTAVMQRGDGVLHVQVTLDTHGLQTAGRTATDFVVVFDRSGSMSGEKMEYGKQALRQLIGRLDDSDRFALVAYENQVEVLVPLGKVARGMRPQWLEEVNRLETAGGTNISAGLDSGLEELRRAADPARASRVLLLSDGLANQGATSVHELGARAQLIVRQESVLTTVGIGADFDENVMTALAKSGAGAFYYLAKLEMLPPLLDAELKTASETYASGAELSIRLPPSVSLLSATGGTPVQAGDQLIVPVGGLSAGRTRSLWLTLRVPTERLQDNDLGTVALRYRRQGKLFESRANALPKVACVADELQFKRRVVERVWEQAMLDEELGKGQEALGAAIRSGNALDVDQAVARANRELKLAQELGNQRVASGMQALAASAPAAKAAQLAPAPARASAAKKATADGFGTRNKDSYRRDFASSASY
jgi:Ca-activated chloride channel family protein